MKEELNIPEMNARIKINEVDLNASMIDQTASRIYYSMMATEAKKEFELAKRELSIVESGLYLTVKQEAVRRNVKETEKSIESKVRMMEEWRKASSEVIDKDADYRMLSEIVSSFDQRSSMIVQIAKMKQAELNSLHPYSGSDEISMEQRKKNALRGTNNA